MSKSLKILFFTVIGLCLIPSRPIIYESTMKPVELSPDVYLQKYARVYGSNLDELRKVMHCESSGKQRAVGDGGRAIGIFQFHKQTWDMFSKKLGETLDINSYHDQTKLAAWAFSRGLQSHWTCYKLAVK